MPEDKVLTLEYEHFIQLSFVVLSFLTFFFQKFDIHVRFSIMDKRDKENLLLEAHKSGKLKKDLDIRGSGRRCGEEYGRC